jgi:hypothetical protein
MCHAKKPVDVVPPLLNGPPVRPWSLEGDATTPWLLTMLPEPLSTVQDVCAVVCCRAACTAAVPSTGQLGTYGVEETTSSSTRKSVEVSARCSTICTIMLSEETSKNLMPSPLPGAPNVGEGILRLGGGMHPP